MKSHVEFNSEYKKFYNYEIENFMNNHLNYKYNPQSDDDDDEDEDVDDDNNVVEITLDQYSQFIIYSQLLIDTNRTNNSSPLQNPLEQEEEEQEEELEMNIEREEEEELEMNIEREEEDEEEYYFDDIEDEDSIS